MQYFRPYSFRSIALVMAFFDNRAIGLANNDATDWINYRDEIREIRKAVEDFQPNKSCDTIGATGRYQSCHSGADKESLQHFSMAVKNLETAIRRDIGKLEVVIQPRSGPIN